MIYRTYSFKELSESYQWHFPTADGKSDIYYTNKDTLAYAASGSVASWSIDEDYLVNNNSTVGLCKKTNAVTGQIITLIETSGSYDLGVITAVDNENLQITYKSITSMFDTSILNPTRGSQDEDSAITYLYDAVNDTARILASYFCTETVDKYFRIPFQVQTEGGGYGDDGKLLCPAVWSYTDDSINLLDWLQDLFDNHNVLVQASLTFTNNYAYILLRIVHNTTGGKLIKNNIHGMTITHTDDSSAQATVCEVLDSETKARLGTYYLLADNTVTTNADATDRVQPYKLVTATFDSDNEDGATLQDVAEDALLYSDFNHYISIKLFRDSAMFPESLTIGDSVTIVPTILDMTTDDSLNDEFEDDTMYSIYTGRKESSDSYEVTLIFGKIRINYTDLMQMRTMKKVRS